MTALVAATLGSPVIKRAAFSYGVRKTSGDRQRGGVQKQVRGQLRSDKASRKAAERGGAPPGPESRVSIGTTAPFAFRGSRSAEPRLVGENQ